MEIKFLKADGFKPIILNEGKVNILIDCNKYSIESKNLRDGFYVILLTNSSKDSIEGLNKISELLDENERLVLAVSREIYEDIKDKINLDNFKIRFYSTNDWSFHISNFEVMPFICTEDGKVGFKINNLLYCEKLDNINKDLLKKVTTIITNENSFKKLKEIANTKFIERLVVHNNIDSDTYETASDLNINEFIVASDNLFLNIENFFRGNLSMKNTCLFLPKDHAKESFSDKKLILHSNDYNRYNNKILYLASGDLCYGIIRLLKPKKINMEGVKNLQKYHLNSDEEIKKWWPKKEILFAYPFEIIEEFDYPRKIRYNKEDNYDSIKNIEFDEKEELIKDIEHYNPEKKSTTILKDDWRLLCAYYSSKKQGKDIKYTFEIIINIAKLVYEELKSRGINFHPENMKKYPKELYEKVSNDSIIDNEELDLKDPKILESMEDIKIIKDFISVCGSVVNGDEDEKSHDMDLIVRLNNNHSVKCPKCNNQFIFNANEYIKRAIETRLLKSSEKIHKDLAGNLHFIFGDSEGSHDSFIPLYDLVLKKIDPLKVVEMMELESKPRKYIPQKPDSPAFNDIESVLDELNEFPYIVEEKVNGFHVICIKDKDKVKIYTEEGNDITKYLEGFSERVKSLSDSSFAIDGELIYLEKGKQKGRAELVKFVTGDIPEDDSNIGMKVWDITYYKKDIKNLPLRTRTKYLNKLNFGKKITEVKSKIAYNKNELEKLIKNMANIKYSEGAVIKQANSKYNPGGESKSWIKYRKLIEIVGKVIKKIKNKSGNYNYLIGVKPTKSNIPNSKIIDGLLELGKTFNTNKNVDEGSKVKVKVEEVWRHEVGDDIYYSIHKPRFVGETKDNLTSLKELDEIVVSVGSVVKEHKLAKTYKNFPKQTQESFKKNMDKWNDFVIQAHSIGESLHYDIRHKVNDHLEGFTLFTEGSWPEVTDLRSKRNNIRCTLKESQPLDWIDFEGLTEPGGLGAERSEKYGGVFTIICEGKYKVINVDDHKIQIEYKSKEGKISDKPKKDAKEKGWPAKDYGESYIDFDGKYSCHIAHIGSKYIILFDKLKSK